ncbi:MAG: hypothetical protein ACKOA8_19760, partial [Deltaproteobacteria bacterium]
MSKQSKTWLSFPKVIAVVAVFCSFVLVKFQTPVTPKVPHKRHAKRVAPKLKAATLETQKVDIDLKKNETLSQAEVNLVSQGPSLGLSRCHRVFEGLGKYQSNLSAAHQEDKKELKLSRVKSKQALATKINKAQSLKKKTEKQLKLSKRIVLPQWIIDDIENPELNSQDGLDNPSPLDELAKSSFLENSLSDNFDPNPLVALVQIRSLLDSDYEFETERPLMVRESLFQKISFADLEESLQNIKKSEVKRVSDIQSPKAKMAWAKITDIPKVVQLRDIQNSFEIEKPKTDSVLEEISDSQISKLAPEVERTQNEAESKRQEKRQANQEVGQPMAGGLKLESPPKLELRPKLASVGDDLENTFEKTVQLAKSKLLNTQVNTVEPVSESRGVNNQKDPSEEDSSDHSSGGVFYGELQVDDLALNWLNSQKGHIELFLNRVGSKDPQDTVFLMDYQFPGSGNQFEFDGTGMKGKYRLVAGVYTPASAVPVAQVMYSKVISSENYKEKIKFEVSHTAISTAPGRSESQRLSENVP